ncbi:hypothetical protein TASCI_20431 [Tenacibaculum ascidiaceicola]
MIKKNQLKFLRRIKSILIDFLVDGLYDLYNLKKEINYKLEISYTGYVRISNKQRKADLKSEFIINTK